MGILDWVLGEDGYREPAACIIKVNGREIADLYPYIREVTVAMSRKEATVCTVVFETMRDEFGRWSVQDSEQTQLREWMRFDIEVAFGHSHREGLMGGYIKKVDVSLPQDMSASTVTVTAQDESYLLDRTHEQKPLSTSRIPQDDSTIITQLAMAARLAFEGDKGMTSASLNLNGPAARLIRERAEANGYEFYVRNGTLYFHSLRLEGQPQSPPIMIHAGRATNCLSFSVSYDGHLPDKVAFACAPEKGSTTVAEPLSSRLPLLGTKAVGSADMGLPEFTWQMQQANSSSPDELKTMAQAKANENSWKVAAEGELDGSLYGHVLLTHKTVKVDGAGERDGGIYYVDEVTHKFTTDGYRQKFKLIRNATGATDVVLAAAIG